MSWPATDGRLLDEADVVAGRVDLPDLLCPTCRGAASPCSARRRTARRARCCCSRRTSGSSRFARRSAGPCSRRRGWRAARTGRPAPLLAHVRRPGSPRCARAGTAIVASSTSSFSGSGSSGSYTVPTGAVGSQRPAVARLHVVDRCAERAGQPLEQLACVRRSRRITFQSTVTVRIRWLSARIRPVGVEDAATLGRQRRPCAAWRVSTRSWNSSRLDALEEPQPGAERAEQQQRHEREHAEPRAALIDGHGDQLAPMLGTARRARARLAVTRPSPSTSGAGRTSPTARAAPAAG